MIDLTPLEGFEWDDANREKNWVKHAVTAVECEEVFFNLPLILRTDPQHAQKEERYYVLGQTTTGRNLFIAFTLREKKIRVISARDMNRKERESYAKAIS
jgi:uncharacterized DUF497 family protein